MSESLFNDLRRIGIDEELTHRVGASLNPDHNASKKDALVMQVQLQNTDRHHQLSSKIDKVDDSSLKMEIAAMFWITFGGLITTAITRVFDQNSLQSMELRKFENPWAASLPFAHYLRASEPINPVRIASTEVFKTLAPEAEAPI